MITALTSAKMPIEIAVANQYTAWIRSNSSDAEVGSHLKTKATTVRSTATTTPTATSCAIPLRTEARLLQGCEVLPREELSSLRLTSCGDDAAPGSAPRSGHRRARRRRISRARGPRGGERVRYTGSPGFAAANDAS